MSAKTAARSAFATPGRLALTATGAIAAMASLGCVLIAGSAVAGLGAGLWSALAVSCWWIAAVRRPPPTRMMLASVLVIALLALSGDPDIQPWAIPARIGDLIRLTPVGAMLATTVYLAASAFLIFVRGRAPTGVESAIVLAIPYGFNALLALASPGLLTRFCAVLGIDPAMGLLPVRVFTLFFINVLLLVGVGWLLDRRGNTALRIHLLLLLAAVLAVISPALADLGGDWRLVHWPAALRIGTCSVAAALSQASLWAEVFLMTGLLLDALRGRRPTFRIALAHWVGGFRRGAVFGGLYLLLIQSGIQLVALEGLASLSKVQPAIAGAIAGAGLFPLMRTILESFDGSPPFFRRLHQAYRDPQNAVRGAVAGCGIGIAVSAGLTRFDDPQRFAVGALIGALAYAGTDAVRDCGRVLSGSRRHLGRGRLYLVGALLGGFMGGALAWYFDAAQSTTVLDKFRQYAQVNFAASGGQPFEFVVYPLFSKWGPISLGTVGGGCSLFWSESMAGVINWALAAPLFGVNLVLLTALVQRSLAPVRELASTAGLVDLVGQTVRVLRWGPWMAPIIASFLRMSSQPTWYNQDGLIRTVVSLWQDGRLSAYDFHAWSVECFVGLLAYGGLRILVWFDHMGLRVATLVNLSFVGADVLDERLARFTGHAGRTRVIPEGIRRFFTWTPLLIPFYLPRGADWDRAWTAAELLSHRPATPLPPSVRILLTGYAIAAVIAVASIMTLLVVRKVKGMNTPPRVPEPMPFRLSNGRYTLEMNHAGCGYSHVNSELRPGFEIDLTRRPDDPLQQRGKFFWLREVEEGAEIGLPWSLTQDPAGRLGPDHAVEPIDPTTLRIVNTRAGLRIEATVSLSADLPVEHWRLRLTNLKPRARTLELTSYRELALAATDSYRRTPAFAAMHVSTTFLKPLGAILYRNRLLKGGAGPISPEVGFHAVAIADRPGIRLVGYEDSRIRFIGSGTMRQPDALAAGGQAVALRSPEDEGTLYTFDPIASLRLHLDLAAEESVELHFIDGYAADSQVAARIISSQLNVAPVTERSLLLTLARHRELHEPVTSPAGGAAASFTRDGSEVRADAGSVRPWTHVLANPEGHGAVISADGEVFSFDGNAQQNAITPFALEGLPTQVPGQFVCVIDPDSGEADSAGLVPWRRGDGERQVHFGLGYARFGWTRGDLALEELISIPHDAPLLLRILRIRNQGAAARRLRVVQYAQIVLAETPVDSRGRIEEACDELSGALLFNRPDNDFRKGWAFVATSLENPAYENVRSRFLGEARMPGDAHFIRHGKGDVDCEDDGLRCAAFAGEIEVPGGGEQTVVFVLGQARDKSSARSLVAHYRRPPAAQAAVDAARQWWQQELSVLRIETDRPEFDRLVNDWLPYQVRCSRLWGRTGPQQRSGAFGFRDQLQDVLPLCATHPQRARAQILLHAARQFCEGDVVKWWHTAWDGGCSIAVRTAASDPQLWLPYVAIRYVRESGDEALWSEIVPFLDGRPLPVGQEGLMFVPPTSLERGSVYEHCRRAIEWTLSRIGPSGVPLMGSGDWNDGIDGIGLGLRGESAWMGFFLHQLLLDFAPVTARFEGEAARRRYEDAAAGLRKALESWWRSDDRFEGYVRATTDRGEPMVYADALLTAWPALSGAVDLPRALAALEAGLRRLERDERVLLGPAFDEDSHPYPGRIAEYPPGVRENGGQYSHGDSWIVDAYMRCAAEAAGRGDTAATANCRERAWEIWWKISPLSKTGAHYGLPPHQQPADVYDGIGHGGRGGWAWYTGAAARMISASHALLGIHFIGGQVKAGLPAAGTNAPRLRRIIYRGQEVFHDRTDRP